MAGFLLGGGRAKVLAFTLVSNVDINLSIEVSIGAELILEEGCGIWGMGDEDS
jgi:hypothetical protein